MGINTNPQRGQNPAGLPPKTDDVHFFNASHLPVEFVGITFHDGQDPYDIVLVDPGNPLNPGEMRGVQLIGDLGLEIEAREFHATVHIAGWTEPVYTYSMPPQDINGTISCLAFGIFGSLGQTDLGDNVRFEGIRRVVTPQIVPFAEAIYSNGEGVAIK